MSGLTTNEANALLNASTINATYSYTTSCKLALCTATGNATTAGTEVTGGAGPYARQTATFATGASGGAISNTSAITYSGMPAGTVTGVDLYDTAGTPNRKWWGGLTTSRALLAGDSLSFAIGALTLTLT